MFQRASVVAGQYASHASQANAAGMTHGGKYEVEVTVGVTETDRAGTVMAHGCPSIMVLKRTLRPGDGQAIPVSNEYKTCYPDGLPPVTGSVMLRALMTVSPNGVLSMRNPRDVRVVPIPAKLAENDYPYARQGGAEMVARALGCGSDVNLMFERHGQTVEV